VLFVGAILSLLSIVVVLKFENLIARQRLRARVSIRLLEENDGSRTISKVDEEVRVTQRGWMMSRISLNTLWAGLFALFFIVGVLGLLLT
jgi:hypothetical protein